MILIGGNGFRLSFLPGRRPCKCRRASGGLNGQHGGLHIQIGHKAGRTGRSCYKSGEQRFDEVAELMRRDGY
jgi:hypothetical protein